MRCARRSTKNSPSATRHAPAVVALGLFTLAPNTASAQHEHRAAGAHENLGAVHFEVSCRPEVQADFDRAVALLHHMTYEPAREAFQRVAAADPRCAMAQWGIAMTLFQPLWPTRPSGGDLRRGWAAVERAKALAPATDRERRFVAALEAFFRDPDSADYWARIRAWEQAMADLYRAYPDDIEAAAFYALAHLAAAPPSGSLDHQERAAEILLRIHRRAPTHPGAVHYTIHANDVTGRERESLEIVRSYDELAPRNAHALHMPTHIYVRLGSWQEVVDGNLKAAEAALDQRAGERGEYVSDEFPHTIEYLVYAYLQRGDDRAAAAAMERLRQTPDLQPSFKTAFNFASIPARYALERQAWAEAAVLEPRQPDWIPWDRFPWAEGVSWFARGLGNAQSGDAAAARQALERLANLRARADAAGEQLFAAQIEILRLELAGWIAHGEGNDAEAVRLLREASRLEATTPKSPVTPAPTIPADELLGDLLSELGRTADALDAYERTLSATPGRLNALLGAARAASALGDAQRGRGYYEQVVRNAHDGSGRAGIAEAKRYVAAGR